MCETDSNIQIQWDDFANLDVPVIFDAAGLSFPVSDIPKLVERVKQYLKVNHISNYVFASKVLNVTGCFFSTMISSSREDMKWGSITKKQQVCFARLQYWMDYRATYGNNPKASSKGDGKRGVSSEHQKKEAMKRPRTLLESLNRTHFIDCANSNLDLETVCATEVVANEVNNNNGLLGLKSDDPMETFSNVEVLEVEEEDFEEIVLNE